MVNESDYNVGDELVSYSSCQDEDSLLLKGELDKRIPEGGYRGQVLVMTKSGPKWVTLV